jgi:hypothetical protein
MHFTIPRPGQTPWNYVDPYWIYVVGRHLARVARAATPRRRAVGSGQAGREDAGQAGVGRQRVADDLSAARRKSVVAP